MRRNAAKGMSVVASKQHYLARDWIDFSLENNEVSIGSINPQFVDSAVEIGQVRDNEYRPAELSICTIDPYL